MGRRWVEGADEIGVVGYIFIPIRHYIDVFVIFVLNRWKISMDKGTLQLTGGTPHFQ
jgi:hypothetical protein